MSGLAARHPSVISIAARSLPSFSVGAGGSRWGGRRSSASSTRLKSPRIKSGSGFPCLSLSSSSQNVVLSWLSFGAYILRTLMVLFGARVLMP